MFKAESLQLHDIVFLGNSITQLGRDWGTRLNNPAIKNRGIAGDVTDGVIHRLGEITYIKPTAVFLENDKMKKELTRDGVHLNDKGYEVWVAFLKKIYK